MLSPSTGVASDETGQLNVALSGATEESALAEDGKVRRTERTFVFRLPHKRMQVFPTNERKSCP